VHLAEKFFLELELELELELALEVLAAHRALELARVRRLEPVSVGEAHTDLKEEEEEAYGFVLVQVPRAL
jgi:hypothetical protein